MFSKGSAAFANVKQKLLAGEEEVEEPPPPTGFFQKSAHHISYDRRCGLDMDSDGFISPLFLFLNIPQGCVQMRFLSPDPEQEATLRWLRCPDAGITVLLRLCDFHDPCELFELPLWIVCLRPFSSIWQFGHCSLLAA